MDPLKHARSSLQGKPTDLPQLQDGGATWHRLDLHLHSPSVLTFALPKGKKREDGIGLADVYIEQLSAQGISVAAITDYNGIDIEWFEVTAAKASNRGITLFPGVEMTFRQYKYGLHILAIFAGDTDLNSVNMYLRSLDKDPTTPLFDNRGSHRDIDLKASLTDSLKGLRSQFNCLLILPHPDQTNGLCKSLTAEVAGKLLLEIGPDAIECCPEKEKNKLQSTGTLPADFWDRVALVEFSNPKQIEEIGTQHRASGTPRATYLKLSATNLDALRLALHNPQTRLSLGGIPSANHPRIRSIAISGSGFLGNLNISWNPDLNVIIGGRGVGKSAILEALRYAFATPPHSDQSSPKELVGRALGRDGRIEVILDRPIREGKIRQYRIVRAWGEEPHTFQVNPEKPLKASPSELLTPDGGLTVFGQHEIRAVSGSQDQRLELLDDLLGEQARKCAEAVKKAMESLSSNTTAIQDLQTRLTKREEYSRRLKEIDHEIETLKAHGQEGPKEGADSRSLGGCLKNATNTLRNASADCDQRRLNLLAILDSTHRNLAEVEDKPSPILQDAIKVLSVLEESLKVVLDDQTTLFEQAIQGLARLDMRLQEKLRTSDAEANKIEKSQKTEPMGQDQVIKLTQEKTSLSSLIAEFNETQDRLKILRQERKALLQQLGDCRSKQNGLRKERADTIAESLNGRVHLQVEFKGQKESYKGQLFHLLKGSNIAQGVIDQLVLPEATDGIALAEAVRAGSKEVQTHFGLNSEMADRLIHWLAADEFRLLQLETLIPQDALRLEMKIDGQSRSLEHLSANQGAVEVMLLLLGLKSQILVIDQPEEYLEDRFVHEEILQILREQKGLKNESSQHQIILTTNDPTIPLVGDAELVIPLEIRGDRAHVISQASSDDRLTQEFIKARMQGGKEVLQKRGKRYGN
ncbi:MAG TPA: AAA family ATPase [Thermodesulfobacteriota bacterium]|nr:AAA family ATPase [Thermodesulfobacteriota bacterium]